MNWVLGHKALLILICSGVFLLVLPSRLAIEQDQSPEKKKKVLIKVRVVGAVALTIATVGLVREYFGNP